MGLNPGRFPKWTLFLRSPWTMQRKGKNFSPTAEMRTLPAPGRYPERKSLQHRLGGLEKQDGTGNVSYDPENHQRMTDIRAEKVAKVAEHIPEAEIFGGDSGDILLVGWGGTYGAIHTATERLRSMGHSVSHMHIRYLNPLPRNVFSAMEDSHTSSSLNSTAANFGSC